MNPRNLIIVMALLGGAAVAQTGSAPTAPAAKPSTDPAKPAAAQPATKQPAEPFYSQSLNADAQPSAAKPVVKRSAAPGGAHSKAASATKQSGAKASVATQAATPFAKPSAGRPAATPASATKVPATGATAKTAAASSTGAAATSVATPVKPGAAAMTAKPSAGTIKPAAAGAGTKPALATAKPAVAGAKPAAGVVKPGSAVGTLASAKKGGVTQPAISIKPADKNAKSITAAKPAIATNAPVAKKPEEKPIEVVKLQPARRSMAGMRDPFISPIVKAMGTGSGCTTGKRCLVIDQIKLKGIVDAPSGMIAVVENAADRTYFLRENDPLFNGMVTHVTRDSVVFRENIMDSAGRSTGTRDVVKRVTAPAV